MVARRGLSGQFGLPLQKCENIREKHWAFYIFRSAVKHLSAIYPCFIDIHFRLVDEDANGLDFFHLLDLVHEVAQCIGKILAIIFFVKIGKDKIFIPLIDDIDGNIQNRLPNQAGYPLSKIRKRMFVQNFSPAAAHFTFLGPCGGGFSLMPPAPASGE